MTDRRVAAESPDDLLVEDVRYQAEPAMRDDRGSVCRSDPCTLLTAVLQRVQPEVGEIRSFGVKVKLNAQRNVLDGKRVVVVDDSIVRGTTSRKIVGMIRAAGAREVHFRVSAPPTISPCYYGVDTPTHGELVANKLSVNEIRDYIGADSLSYLSDSGLYAFVGGREPGFCDACFTGNYPVATTADHERRQMKLFEARELGPDRVRKAKDH